MKKLVLLFFTALVMFTLTGCESKSKSESETKQNMVKNFQENLYYFKDDRTGICYSAISRSSTNLSPVSHVVVPCSPEVENILVNK